MSAVINSAEQSNTIPTDKALLERLSDLFSGSRSGNMGPDLYRNGGAVKFEKILQSNGNYTPFAGEVEILTQNKAQISEWVKDLKTVIIVGPGPARSVGAKERLILEGMPHLERAIPMELSPTFNQQTTKYLRGLLPNVAVIPFPDYRDADLSGVLNSKPALVISTGSFTNYEDCQTQSFPSRKVLSHLTKLSELAGKGGKVLWGYNSHLDADQYNTPIVDDFLMYPLEKASRMEGVRLDPSGFIHETRAFKAASTLTHYWRAIQDQDILIGGEAVAINKDELFPMFFSVAQSPERLERLLNGSSNVTKAFFYKGKSGAVIHGFDCV